jgi:hypothetical protein
MLRARSPSASIRAGSPLAGESASVRDDAFMILFYVVFSCPVCFYLVLISL